MENQNQIQISNFLKCKKISIIILWVITISHLLFALFTFFGLNDNLHYDYFYFHF